MIPSIKRGDIFYADLSPVIGSEQGGLRPVLIIQNDVGNKYSPTVIAAAITSKTGKAKLPTHIDIYAQASGLLKDSVILLEQIRTLDKRRLKEKTGHLSPAKMVEVDNAIAVSLSLLGAAMPGAAVPGAAVPGAAVSEPAATGGAYSAEFGGEFFSSAATLPEEGRAVSDISASEEAKRVF
ncbi:MAG: type II toxin-antitoxin system PemK/MazF family toxin [Ruminococcaceae bacterium]|nr:type II toxin-antitoxin system PemK/MazF family toxin [Oscillospiraceae bacterium]